MDFQRRLSVFLFGCVGLLFSDCATHHATHSSSDESGMKIFNRAIASFSNTFAGSREISDFSKRFDGENPTIEIARSRGLSIVEERMLRHRLIRDLLSHSDRISLVIGPGRTRLSTSRDRYHLLRHGKTTDAMATPGHVMPANFVIFSAAGRDSIGNN